MVLDLVKKTVPGGDIAPTMRRSDTDRRSS